MKQGTTDPAQQVGAGGALGRLVVEKGLATPEEVERCLRVQAENEESGVFLKLGEIFVREGLLSPEQVQDLLALQHIKILVCSKCFTKYNVEGWSPGMRKDCIRCAAPLVEPEELSSLSVEDTVGEEEEPRVTELGILHQGTRLFGGYEILGEISRGGMGIVYKARQQELGRIVALKVLLAGGESLEEDVQRFQREARAVARLRHQNIVGIHEIGEVRGIHFFSMNYIQGISLDQLIEDGAAERRRLLEILCTLCDAVQYAHHEGVLHRDLKPSNILVTQEGEPYLIDFGIAKFRGADGQQLTKKGYLYGSPLYMAPEYVSSRIREFDARCDVYALGVILYKMLSGHTPYEDDETMKILRRILQENPAPVGELAAGSVDRDLATVCHMAIERDPHRRYQSPGELGADLRRYLTGEEIVARPRSVWYRLWVKAREKVAFLVTLVLCTLVLSGAIQLARQGNRLAELEQQLQEEQRAAVRRGTELEGLLASLERLPESAARERARARVLRLLGRVEQAREAERRAAQLGR